MATVAARKPRDSERAGRSLRGHRWPRRGETDGCDEAWLAKVIYDLVNPYVKDNSFGPSFPGNDLQPSPDRRSRARPDVAFISFERWARNRPVPQTRSWAVVPDLAIEIVSQPTPRTRSLGKLEEYFRVGVRSVWVVYPRQFNVYAYRSPTELRGAGGR